MSVSEIGDGAVRVRVGTKEKIVRAEKGGEAALEMLLADRSLAVSPEEVKKVITSSLQEGRYELTALALLLFSRETKLTINDYYDFLHSLGIRKGGIDALKRALNNKAALETLRAPYQAVLLLLVAVDDPVWVRLNALKKVYVLEKPLRKVADLAFYKSLTEEPSGGAQRVSAMLRDVFGVNDAQYQQLALAEDRYKKALQLVKKKNIEDLHALADPALVDPQLSNILTGMLVALIHSEARSDLKKRAESEALLSLSRVPPRKRTLETHELVLEALKLIVPDRDSVLLNVRIDLFLRSLAPNDGRILSLYVKRLEELAHFYLAEGEVDQVDQVLKRIVAVRPDPDSANDAIRLRQVYGFLNKGHYERARLKYHALKTTVSLFDRTSLLFRGFFLPLSVVYLLCGIPIVTALLMWFGRILRSGKYSYLGRRKIFQEEEMEEIPGSGFSPRYSSQRNSFERDEYIHCLRELGLFIGASLAEIKTAYRVKIKEYHPDTRGASDPGKDERFIELTRTYERLLELDEKFGTSRVAGAPEGEFKKPGKQEPGR